MKTSKKKDRKRMREYQNITYMVQYLEEKWKSNVNYTCQSCLKEAYNSVQNNCIGYVTDEDLIISSKNTLRHK